MIAFSTIAAVLKGYVSTISRNRVAGVFVLPSDSPPRYASSKGERNPICEAAKSNDVSRATCNAFYRQLSCDGNQAICPFGVEIRYKKTENAPSVLGCCVQLSCSASRATADLSAFPRDAKKAMKRALGKPIAMAMGDADAEDILVRFSQMLETLLAGRVAASMRSITHQLLTPVQGIMNDILQLRSEGNPIFDRLERNARALNNCAKRIHILLSERLEANSKNLRNVTVHNVIKNVCDSLRLAAESRHLEIEHQYNKYSKMVSAIPDQLEIVLSALIENAIKYSFKGTAVRPKRITIAYSEYEGFLKITISNFGCAITPVELDERRIFELGYRGECSGDRGRTGTGSGLHVADLIVKAHRGKIEVASRYENDEGDFEKGALNIFTVWWPRQLQL